MRVHSVGRRPATRMLICLLGLVVLAGLVSGVLPWCWTQAACLLSLHAPMRLPAGDAARAMWRLCCTAAGARPTVHSRPPPSARRRPERLRLRCVAGVLRSRCSGWAAWRLHRRRACVAGRVAAGQGAAHARAACLDRGWVRSAHVGGAQRPAAPVGAGPGSRAAPISGVIGGLPARMLAAELEVQPMVVAPPRAGKSSGFVVPWLLEHDGPGARALDQARHLRRDRSRYRARPRAGVGV